MKSKLFILSLSLSLSMFSCYKHENPKMELTVLDANNNPIQGVSVNIKSPTGNYINENKITSYNGKIYYSSSYECILEVNVTHSSISKSELVQLKDNEIATKTILIK